LADATGAELDELHPTPERLFLLASNFEGAHMLLLELEPEPEACLIVNASRKLVR
jgi:hypothetical protein